LHVRTDIDQGGEAGVSARRASNVAEHLIVEGAAALVPKIVGRGELKEVHVGSELDLAGRLVDHLNKLLAAVHVVIERESGEDARSGKHLEKRAMPAVAGSTVSCRSEEPAAKPRRSRYVIKANARFCQSRTSAMVEHAPLAILKDSPEKYVHAARANGNGGDEIRAISS